MNTHEQYTELMSLALDGEATPEELGALQAHLGSCEACAVTWGNWQALDARFRMAPVLAPSPDMVDQVITRLETRKRRRFWTGWLGASLLLTWIVIAGIALLLIVGCVGWGVTHPLQASVVLSASTHLLSGFLWPVRGVEVALITAGLSLWTGIGGYLIFTGCLLAFWVWWVVRRGVLSHSLSKVSPEHFSEED